VGGLVGSAPVYASSLGSNPDISQKHKMGGIRKGVANTLYPAQKIYKNKYFVKEFPYSFFVRR
jgi:hypothetical protein